jgi:trigger factor
MAEDTSVVDAPPTATATEEKLTQQVEIKDVGACKKHVRVVVDRKAIDERFKEKYDKLAKESRAQLDGFRPGKAPKSIIVRRFKPQVTEEVRNEVLMASLEQLADEQKLSPLSPPEIDPDKIELPEDGPFTYEFQVEVRPEFELPNYRGLKLRKPVKTFSKDEILKSKNRLLEPYGQLVPKDGPVEEEDTIIVDMITSLNGVQLNEVKEARLRVVKQLVLTDGVAKDFAKNLVGAKAGDERTVEIAVSEQVANVALRGKTIQATMKILDVKYIRLPEVTPELLREEFDVRNEDQLEELIEVNLQRRLEYLQHQSYREQILAMIGAANDWELPRDLLIKQSRRAFSRKVMEMQSAGISDEEIEARQQMLSQDVLRSSAQALREHFVLQKIAELENLEINEEDINAEIDRIADREGESPRKVRARMEREDLIEALATDLLERRALQIVLDTAEYEEVTASEDSTEAPATSMDAPAVPGGMNMPEVESTPEGSTNS